MRAEAGRKEKGPGLVMRVCIYSGLVAKSAWWWGGTLQPLRHCACRLAMDAACINRPPAVRGTIWHVATCMPRHAWRPLPLPAVSQKEWIFLSLRKQTCSKKKINL